MNYKIVINPQVKVPFGELKEGESFLWWGVHPERGIPKMKIPTAGLLVNAIDLDDGTLRHIPSDLEVTPCDAELIVRIRS